MSRSHSTQSVNPSIDRRADTDVVPMHGMAKRGNLSRTMAVAAVSAIGGLGILSAFQGSQARGDSERSPRPVEAQADMTQVYGPTLAELQAEPVGCTIILESGDTAASVASKLLGGDVSPYGHAILRHISQQGEGEGSAEGMLMEGQTVEIPVSHCGAVVDQAPTE